MNLWKKHVANSLAHNKNFDTQAAKATLFRECVSLESLRQQEQSFEIKDIESQAQAVSMSLQCRKLKSQLDKLRKEIIKPFFDYQKTINSYSKEFEKQLDDIEESLSLKLQLYQAGLKKEVSDTDYSLATQSIKTEDGSAKLVLETSFEIEDFNKIPREFLKIDETKVKQAIDFGVRNIEGIKIFTTEKLVMRAK